MSKPLIVISSRTGNTMAVGHAICDALPHAELVSPAELPADLTDYNPVLLGFWRNNDDAPEEMFEVATHLHDKTIGCFATMAGDPDEDEARHWMQDTCARLVAVGEGNRLSETFLCRGRMDPKTVEQMTKLLATEPSRTHPDRLDLARAAELFRGAFGMNW